MLVLHIIDILLYILTSVGVIYLFFFAIASVKKNTHKHIAEADMHRILVLIPAYKEDRMIIPSAQSACRQTYPTELYEIVVISDHMSPQTDTQLRESGAKVLNPVFEESSKAKALNFAITEYKDKPFDILVILDADNTVESNFLSQINSAYSEGYNAIQAHRIAANTDTDTALLDAVSEEINNNIFRKGHNNVHLPSALIGSGMAFDFQWFVTNIQKVFTAGEDKELELLLLQEKINILYLDDCYVQDYKTRNNKAFYNQRRRWQASQYDTLKRSLAFLPQAIAKHNFGLLDKIIQWTLLPRVVLLLLIVLCCLISFIISPLWAIKWAVLLVLLIGALLIAIPAYLWNKQLAKASMRIPVLGTMMVLNLLRLKGAARKFIHTKKE